MSRAQVTPERVEEIRALLSVPADAWRCCDSLTLEATLWRAIRDLLTALEAQRDAYDRAISNYQAQADRAESAERQLAELRDKWAPVADKIAGVANANIDAPVDYVNELIEQLATVTQERDEAISQRDDWRRRFGLQTSIGWQTAAQAEALHQEAYQSAHGVIRAERDALKQERDAMRAALTMLQGLLRDLHEGDDGVNRPDRHFGIRTLGEAQEVVARALGGEEG